jgi:hypothetical protein
VGIGGYKKMYELYKIVGLRDIDSNVREDFMKFIESDSPEAEQIRNGYTNPLIVANILRCRVKCLEDVCLDK